MKTQTQLFTGALRKAGAGSAGSGQTPSAEDLAICAEYIGPLLDTLRATEVCNVVVGSNLSEEVIEDHLYLGLINCLALEIQGEFGKPEPTDADREDARKVLRRITAAKPTYEVLEAVYF